ncbi:MAG: Flp family type IVb pilin [Caldilineales bacterium]|nr:Flp family type IVb pilin [Caldilineales bacterium]
MIFQLMSMLMNYVDDEEGAELAEYGLVLALIAVVAIGALTALGGGISGTLGSITAELGG